MHKIKYEQPTTDVVRLRCREQILGTSDASVGSFLGFYIDGGGDAWGGSGSAGRSSMGGWTDNGNSAW